MRVFSAYVSESSRGQSPDITLYYTVLISTKMETWSDTTAPFTRLGPFAGVWWPSSAPTSKATKRLKQACWITHISMFVEISAVY